MRATYSNSEVGAAQVITSDAILSITKAAELQRKEHPARSPERRWRLDHAGVTPRRRTRALGCRTSLLPSDSSSNQTVVERSGSSWICRPTSSGRAGVGRLAERCDPMRRARTASRQHPDAATASADRHPQQHRSIRRPHHRPRDRRRRAPPRGTRSGLQRASLLRQRPAVA